MFKMANKMYEEDEKSLKTDFSKSYNNMGLALIHLKRYPEAMEYFQKAMQVTIVCNNTTDKFYKYWIL